MLAKTALFVALAIVSLGFSGIWVVALVEARGRNERILPSIWELFVGLVSDFFDTLGIGSFATTTSLYRMNARRPIDDRLLPGTLNVGHSIPTFAQAFIYIDKVEVDGTTLVTMIAAAAAGAVLGAPVVARLSRRHVQIGMGLALLVLASVLAWRQIGLPDDGSKLGLHGSELGLAIAINFVLGALMTIGVGLYAPCLVLVSLLGMNPKAGFPIMMGSCAFLMPLASIPFIRQKAYAPSAAAGLTLAGLPAVLVAALIVKSLPLYWVKWLVAVVVVYTAFSLLRAARREKLVYTG